MAYQSNTRWLVPVVLAGAVILALAWTFASRGPSASRPPAVDGGVAADAMAP